MLWGESLIGQHPEDFERSKRYFFSNSGYCPRANWCCLSYFSMWVASLKEGDNVLDLWREEGFHDGGGEKKVADWCYLHLIWVYYRSHYIHAQFQPSGTNFGVPIAKTLLWDICTKKLIKWVYQICLLITSRKIILLPHIIYAYKATIKGFQTSLDT